MSSRLQFRRGSYADLQQIVPIAGEPIWTTDTQALYVGNGIDVGGVLISGSVGPQGPQGDIGVQGAQGDIGVQGPQGDIGVQGPQGDIGVQGAQGDIGVQGAQGDIGVQGAQGDIGVQGAQGAAGGGSNYPADAVGYLYDDGVGNISWQEPNALSSGTYVLALSADGILRLNGTVFSPSNGAPLTTSTLINTISTSTLKIVAPPTTLYGGVSDIPGDIAFDRNFIYYCNSPFGTIYTTAPMQSYSNVNFVYARQSDFSVEPQPGWSIQDASSGKTYVLTSVFSGVFLSPPPTVAYYELIISSSVLTYTTSSVFLVSQTPIAPIWSTTPWNAITRADLATNNSGYDAPQYTVVTENNIKAMYYGNGDIHLSSNTSTSLTVSYTGYYNHGTTVTGLSSSTTLTTSSWVAVNAAMVNPGDSMEIKLQDGTHIYRITGMVTPTTNNGTVIIETLV